MKIHLAILKITGLFVLLCAAHTTVQAQCDNPYYEFREGTRFTTESYNAKDKLEGKTEAVFKEVQSIPGGYEATIAFKIYDKKDKLLNEGEYTMTCEDGVVKMDLSNFVPDESMKAFQSMEVKVDMGSMDIPSNLSVGQALDDSEMTISAEGGPIPMNMTFRMTDRKVEGKEQVTTPVGTFDCFKISYNMDMKMMMTNQTMKTVQYLAEKYGVVRTETYRGNGKLVGYSIITRYDI